MKIDFSIFFLILTNINFHAASQNKNNKFKHFFGAVEEEGVGGGVLYGMVNGWGL